MNNCDKGFTIGNFFMSFIIIEDFFGICIRIGKEREMYLNADIYHMTITIGCGQFMVGFIGKEK